jgi:hypothetical protein
MVVNKINQTNMSNKRTSEDMEIDEEPIPGMGEGGGAGMEIETPNVGLERFIRNSDNYRRVMRIYQNAAPGTISNRVCHSKTGLEGDDVQLAHPDSTPGHVICPNGYHPAFKWPFCCVKDGVDERIRDAVVNSTSQEMDESKTKRLRRVEFGRLYRRLRPHASKEITDKKYKAYVKLFVVSHL